MDQNYEVGLQTLSNEVRLKLFIEPMLSLLTYPQDKLFFLVNLSSVSKSFYTALALATKRQHLLSFGIKQIFAQTRYSLFLDNQGQVFICGNSFENLPVPLPALKNIVQIEINERKNALFFLAANGNVFLCKENNEFQFVNQPVLFLQNIKKMTHGSYHSLFLDKNGQVFAWGSNMYGELGIGNKENQIQPVLIPTLKDIIDIAAGASHSVFRDIYGKVYTCGENCFGQLGNGNNEEQTHPVQVSELKKIKQMAIGGGHNLFLDEDGQVTGFGENNLGQLGLGDNLNRNKPVPITTLKDTKRIIVRCDQSFFLNTNGEVSVCGYNSTYGFVGTKLDQNKNLPVALPIQNVEEINPARKCIFFSNTNGQIFFYGSSENNERFGVTMREGEYQPILADTLKGINQWSGSYHPIFFSMATVRFLLVEGMTTVSLELETISLETKELKSLFLKNERSHSFSS